MPKKYRLSHADFVRLPKSGSKRIHGIYFSLTISPLAMSTVPKMASVVSKKIVARAVDRNRIERWCRESLRPHMMGIKNPLALVFYAKREVTMATFGQIKKDIETLLARSGELATSVA